MNPLHLFKTVCLFLFLCLSLSACSTLSGPDRLLLDIPKHAGATEALSKYVSAYERIRSRGHDTTQIRLEIEKLADKYPKSVHVLKKNASIAVENNELKKASKYLDLLYQIDPSLPDIAIIRSQLALQNGNRGTSKKILNTQLKLTPDYAPLYESLAGVYYFEKKYMKAKEALENAFKLGASRSRINYHLGLIEEALEQPDEAIKHYEEALKGDDAFEAAGPRLAALRALNS